MLRSSKLRSKPHRPWQPRMSDGHVFNPFEHTTEPEASLDEPRDIEELEAEAEDLKAEAEELEARKHPSATADTLDSTARKRDTAR